MSDDPRPYHHGNLREALLTAAEQAMERDGVPGLALRELCRAIGVTHAAARRHFADKRALLDELAIRGFDLFGETLGGVADSRDGSFEDRVLQLAQAQLAFAQDRPALYAWMFEAKRQPGAPVALTDASGRAIQRALALYAAGQAAGKFAKGDTQQLGLTTFAAVHGLISVWNDRKDTSLEQATKKVIEQLMVGLRAR